MRPLRALTVTVAAALGSVCGEKDASAAGDQRLVPDLHGKTLRDATCRLKSLGLRWRLRGSRRSESGSPSGCGDNGTGGSMDDLPVTGQTPKAGTRIRLGAAVTLDDVCTDATRQRRAGCL